MGTLLRHPGAAKANDDSALKISNLNGLHAMQNSIICLLVLAALLGVDSAAAQSTSVTQQQKALIGQPAPPLELNDLSLKKHTLSEFKGKVLVINFWATWCAPCRAEIPMLNQLQVDYGADTVQIVGVGIDTPTAIRQFNARVPIRYLILVGGTDAISLVERYGNGAGTLPYTVFVDRQGRIASIANGALTDAFTRRVLDKLR